MYMYITIIIIKSLFQAMPIKVRCTMYNSSNVNPNSGCSSTRTHYYKIKNTHRGFAKLKNSKNPNKIG